MTDQLTPFLTGAYGHPVVKTPNLDKLVENGVRFESAYANSPVCGPSRASMITGRFMSDIKCYDNASPLACDVPSIAHYLTVQGYDTTVSGKMHFLGPDQLHGFHKRLTTDIYPADFSWNIPNMKPGKTMFATSVHARNYSTPRAGVKNWSTGLKYDEETHFRALEYLRDRGEIESNLTKKEKQKPFFLMTSYHHPHDPFFAPQDLWDLYEDENIEIPEIPENIADTYSAMDKWLIVFQGNKQIKNLLDPTSLKDLRRAYYALVTYIDLKVGELLQTLKETNLRDNTIIIFSSDHGDMLCEKGLTGKKLFYEWSSRVPLLISFPDEKYKGKKITEPVSLVDLAPTILDMAGVEDRLPLDGHSLMNLIKESETTEREVFSEMHHEGVYSTCFMLRKKQYKYIYIHGESPQLFNLENDPSEFHNLAGLPEYKEIEETMKARILAQFDPDAIKKDLQQRLLQRELIKESMEINNTYWDYSPEFNATQQYVRRYSKKMNK